MYLNRHTVKTRIDVRRDDPLLDASWRRREGGALSSGDLLAEMLVQSLSDETLQQKQTLFRTVVLQPSLDPLEGQGVFKTARFLREKRRYEGRLTEFYTGRRFARAFPPCQNKIDRYCTIQPALGTTCVEFCRNYRIHQDLFGLKAVGPFVVPFSREY